jgi:hypothetical protein
MQVLLQDIANIRTGRSFRGRIESAPEGAYSVLQIKDVDEGAFVPAEPLLRTDLPEVNPSHLLHRGDVLFVARAARRTAAVVEQEIPNTIFGSQFLVCEPKESVDPAYLAWYINQKPAQRYLEENATGTNVRIVTKEAFGRLPVTVPPLAAQRKIAEVYFLSLREKHLLEEIQTKRGQLIELALLESIHPYEEEGNGE